ncbi:MAG: molybdopterin-dependent oxidoreductase [Nitrospirota bacterium]
MKKWTRREFLKTAAAAAGTLVATDALALDLLAPVADPLGAYPYRGWETLYRDLYTYDYTARSTHSMNCTGSCTWKVFVKNNIAFKEEQYADYPAINSVLPTYNPRGCQKGANFIEYVYGPQRVKYPLIRTGLRGEGKWRKATWAEALSLIASKITSNISANGPDSVFFYSAIPAKHFVTFAGGARLANLTGAVMCSFYDWYCDLPPGEPITWGEQTDACEAADWVNSKYLILWGANLLETRIPDAHFMTEARMRGTKIVAIFPEYNPVSTHADIFVPVKPGTDAALALAMAYVIVNENLYDAAYVKQFTDFPMLVRTDNKKFLRESDMLSGGSADKLYLWDTATAKAVLAPGTLGNTASPTLELGKISPALEGTFTVNTLAGAVQVTTVFSMLKQKLAGYTPSTVAATTGVNSNLIAQIAREFAQTKPGRIIEGAGTNHYYHNDLINRAQILLVALTGNVGKPGGGFDHYVGQEKIWPEAGFIKLAYPLGRATQRFQNTTLWTYVHAGVVSDTDNLLPRPLSQYIRDSVTNGWMPLYPEGTLDSGKAPRVLFIWGANYLNQSKGYESVLATLWPKLDLIVDVNYRMDTSACYADVVLPAASFYEKWDLNSSDLHSFMHPFTPVVTPLWDSKTDWQIWQSLAGALQATGFSYTDAKFGITRNFSTMVNDFTNNGAIAADKAAAQYILDNAVETQGMTMDAINAQPKRFAATSEEWTSDIKAGVAYYGFQRMFELKHPLHTLAGRQQFYIDHQWFLDLQEELPVNKPPVDADAYPLRWITPHGRWSIHSTWRDAKFQLRLQRGRPIVYLSPKEAAARGLVDNDKVEIYNGHGSMIAHLGVSPRLPDGMAQMYHGWERYQFQKGGWQSPNTIRIKPTQLAGGYGQLKFKLNYWGPTGNQKDTRVEIRKAV